MRKEKREKVILLSLILVDQFSKYFVVKRGFGFINKGISFGWFSTPSCLLIFCLVILITVLAMIMLAISFKNKTFMVIILAGGISNLIDRIFRGGVVDFIKLPIIPFFNFADFLICLGLALFLIDFTFKKKLS